MQAGKAVSGFEAGRIVVPRRRTFESQRAQRKGVHWPVALFLIALVIPWVFYIGSLRLSVYRLVLLLTFLPCLIRWIGGKAGRIRIADIALLLYLFWVTLSFVVIHGWESSFQSAGIIILETMGPYLLARCYVRDAEDFYNVVRLLFRIVVALIPFAIIEFVSGVNVSRELFAIVLPTLTDAMPTRLGLTRVQSMFDHPILFGVFTGSIFALVHLVLGYRRDTVQRFSMTAIVGATSMLSVSSGPLTALVTQGFLLFWNALLSAFRFRWILLIALVTFTSLAIELVANRSLLDIVVTHFLFDPGSYWFRKVIWTYGTASALNHPLFGTGLGDWERPPWMSPSIDNFWLLQAVHNGLPAAFLILLAFGSIFLAVGLKKGLDDKLDNYRTGFLIAMTGFFQVGWTVAFWDAAYVLFVFLMGSGVWILDVETKKKSPCS